MLTVPLKNKLFKIIIKQALLGLILGMIGFTSGLVLAIGFGTYYGWVLSRLWVGGIIGGCGGRKHLLLGVIGAFVAWFFGHITGLDSIWVNWLILGSFIGVSGKVFTRVLKGVAAGGAGGLLGGWIYLAMPTGMVVRMECIALAALGWAILGSLIGSVSGIVEKSRRKIIYGIIIGSGSGVVAMFILERIIIFIADVVGIAGSVFMEGAIAGMSIWVVINFVSIIADE